MSNFLNKEARNRDIFALSQICFYVLIALKTGRRMLSLSFAKVTSRTNKLQQRFGIKDVQQLL